MTDVAVANTNTFLVLVLIVLAAVATGMILYFRYRKVPNRAAVVVQPVPAAQSAGTTPQQQQQAAASKPFWKSKWFLTAIVIILVALCGFFLFQAFGSTLASLEVPEASPDLPWLLILAIFVMICLFGIAAILAILGKKGVGLMAGMAFAVLAGLMLVQWLGPENIGRAGERVGTHIADGTFTGSPEVSVNPCLLERVVALPPGEPVTIVRDDRCSYHLQMRWKPKVSATIAVAGFGNLGPYDYIRYPYTPSSFEYEGVTEELTLTNIGDEQTSAMIFYK